MNHKVTLTITSLLSILFAAFHLTDDIVRGFEPGRRSGYVIILLGSILGAFVPFVHMRGTGLVGGRIANSSGVFFWVWTLIALGVTAIFSAILSARGLWSLQRGQSRSPRSASSPRSSGERLGDL